MKHLLLVMAFSGLIAGCATNRDSRALTTTQRLPGAADCEFTRIACQTGVAQFELGMLATRNSENPSVRKLGRSLMSEHSEIKRDLGRLCARKGIQPAAEAGLASQTSLEKLAALFGSDFDRAFKEAVVRHHETTIESFEKQRCQGTDPELKSFTERHLPRLCEHLTAARALAVGQQASAMYVGR
jgi:putative membrane protein